MEKLKKLARLKDFMSLIKVANVNEIKPGDGKKIEVNGEGIVIWNVDGKFFATTSTCHHAGGPLDEGYLSINVITCPLHGWKYDVTTGKSTVAPTIQIKTYPVKVENNEIFVDV